MQQASPDTFVKLAVKAGVYTQSWIDAKGNIHQEVAYISPEYLRESAWSTTEIMKRKLDVPVCLDHKDDAYPKPIEKWLEDEMRTAVGKLISVKYNPVEDSHEYHFSVNDPEIAKKIREGTITKVSPNFHASFEPGDGTIWKNIVRHLALTFRPKDYHQSNAPMASITSSVGKTHGQTRFSVIVSRPLENIKLVPMHKLSFSVLRSLAKQGENGKVTFASVDHKFKFDSMAKFDEWLKRRYQGELRMSVSGKLGHVLYFAVIHAPIGGVTINGRKYLGGQFIPNEHVESLPEADRSRIKESAAASQKRRAEHAAKFVNQGESHGEAIARHAGEHAKAEMSPEDKKATARRWAALRAHHGADALQRVSALAGSEAAQLAKLDPTSDKAKHLARRLRAYHEMAQIAGKPKEVAQDGHSDAMREMAEASKDADDATAAKIKKERSERVTAKIASEIDYHGGWDMLTPEQRAEIESDVNALDKDDEKAEAAIVDKAENYAIDGKWENNKKIAEENERKREEAEKTMLSNHGMVRDGMSMVVDPANLDKAKAFVAKLREGADSHEKSLDPKKHSQDQIKRAMKDVKNTRRDADKYEKQIKDHERNAMTPEQKSAYEAAAKKEYDDSLKVPEDIAKTPKASAEANPLHAEMRKLHDEIQHHEKAARDMQPKNGAIGIGGADFDHTLKRSVAEGYLFALNKGASPEEAHKAAIEAGRHSVKMWNERGSKGRASINSSHELKRWDKSGDDYADTIHRRFARIGNSQKTKAPSNGSYEAEEDKEGNIRGVATLPDGKKIVGKWREKAWHDQDGEKEMHERLKRDVIIKHSYDLDQQSKGARDAADFASRTKGHNDAKKQVLKALYPMPKDRPEVLAEYPEASGFTRKYRIEHSNAGEGNVAYQPVYDRVDEDGKLIDSNNYGSPHESYDNAAREIGVHTHYLSRNGHGDQPTLHDPITKAQHEASKKSFDDATAESARKEEEYKSGETAKHQANNLARVNLQEAIRSAKGKRGSTVIGSGKEATKVSGAQHGNFLVHKSIDGFSGKTYTVTHIPSGMVASNGIGSQGSGLELAHLLEQAGDWSGKNLDRALLEHGAAIKRHHANGDYAKAMERIEQANPKKKR